MSNLSGFLKALNSLVYIVKKIEVNSQESLIINFSDLKDCYAMSKYSANSIITLLDDDFLNRDERKIGEIKQNILTKIERVQFFHEMFIDQLVSFDTYECVRSSLRTHEKAYEILNQKATRCRRELQDIRESLESLCYQYEETHTKMKSLRSEEILLNKELNALRIRVNDAYTLYKKEEKNRVIYCEVDFGKITRELNEVYKYLEKNYLLNHKEKPQYQKDPIFKPEVFGTCHRLINTFCAKPLSEEELTKIFQKKDSMFNKIKLRSSVKEKFYFTIRHFADFIEGTEDEKTIWSAHLISQFADVSLSSFETKGNLLQNNEKYRNEIQSEFLKLKEIYL
ncbi:hypothetical protein [Christiangramia portivictoriae]|uniref:hypothetical protein n=1 Tax=Christiangramia portivictoriae TaxID=326069 RepID=UPI0003FA76A7|nr:hypothetical protein [Christiangramia portivictoriae]